MQDKWQIIAQMVFCGGCLEIHPYGSECISRSGTQHQGGECSTWECVGDKKGGTDNRSIKYPPPAIQGGENYICNRLDQVDREMKRMYGEER